MIIIKKKENLGDHITLRLGGQARYYVEVRNKSELLEALEWASEKGLKVYILGGGANTFFSDKGFPGLVIKNKIRGIRVVRETDQYVWVESDGGEWWTALANYCLEHKYYGLENLFLIPGSVGAAPVQNIGAYGVTLDEVFYSLTAISLRTTKEKVFYSKDCKFGYRDSVFKKSLKGKYFIYSITLRLNKKFKANLEYPELNNRFSEKDKRRVTAHDLVKLITEIRNNKLPVPAVLPNAGSFFKNPELNQKEFDKFHKKFPDVRIFKIDTKYRVAAGWLIDQCGFKGKRFKNVGVYEKQALILVNYGGAKASDLIALSKRIESAVKKKFGLKLEREVNYVQ